LGSGDEITTTEDTEDTKEMKERPDERRLVISAIEPEFF